MAGKQGLTPELRVKKRRDFLRIQSRGKKYRSVHFILAVSTRNAAVLGSNIRLGITVTTKIDKRAARRNRLKRRIREIFRKERTRMSLPAELVLIALSNAAELNYGNTEQEVLSLFERAGMYGSRVKRCGK